MKLIAVGQRVVEETRYEESRDALDSRWAEFLNSCGLVAVPIPNHPETATKLMQELDFSGLLLTGGGDHPKRDATINVLLKAAEHKKLPVIGVCHGMQAMQRNCGVKLEKISGHVAPTQEITAHGRKETVNSYHDYGTKETVAELDVWATAEDGVVKAVKHEKKRWLGIMWHPERIAPFAPRDIVLFEEWFT